MLRRETKYKPVLQKGVAQDWPADGILATEEFIKRMMAEGDVVSVPYDSGQGRIQDMAEGVTWARKGAIAAQENTPLPLNPPVRITGFRVRADNSRDYWIFRGEVYSTDRGVCSAEDVKALALEGENKTKAKLARAHA